MSDQEEEQMAGTPSPGDDDDELLQDEAPAPAPRGALGHAQAQQQPALLPPLAGDDNNNDQADDVNNNTTDPQLQQIQQQQLLQHHQQLAPVPALVEIVDLDSEEVPVSVSQITTSADVPIPNAKSTNPDQRNKKKKKKRSRRIGSTTVTLYGLATGTEVKDEPSDVAHDGQIDNEAGSGGLSVEIEYVPEKLELSVFDPMYKAFANVFENFRISTDPKSLKTEDVKPTAEDLARAKGLSKIPKELELEEDEDKNGDSKPKLSKRKLKKLTRLSVAELKQVVPRPDVVEMHDVTARDPKLLVHLKSYRNTVPVPRHWCFKRKYLQGKRGIEKAPFDLPGFIKKTGIMEMRAALAEKEETKTLKAKMRERVRPKMGKIDIDYQKLHDAFFKWQSKPRMTIHGDLYYEGKEFETRMKDKKPGDLSDDLRTALGMPVGPGSNRIPPPWLIAMQRYGPPPSYPHLKVPGLNAPIPEGTTFGYHAGGWGKPPVDELGRPLYGDVFGMSNGLEGLDDEGIDRTPWGQLESEEEVEESEEEEEEEEGEEEGGDDAAGGGQSSEDASGLQTPAEGLATPSGFSSSVPGGATGLETPELIELRKRRIEQDMEGGETPALYTVLPEKRVDRIAGSMMASTHVYDVSVAGAPGPKGISSSKPDASGRIELALDPSELDLDSDAMAARYEQKLREEQSHLAKEDLSDMVAEHAAKQKNKRKRQLQATESQTTKAGGGSSNKKYKEFKF